MRTLFRDNADKRFIVASFASHLHRVQQVAEAALASGRQLAFVGRSMVNNVTLSREMGLLKVPSDRVIDIEESPRFPPGEVCIICTGSQGEPMSALSLMAAHEHKWVKISEDDVVVISAHAIPGERDERHPHHQLAVPRRCGSGARRERAGARLRARVAGRAEVHDEPGQPEWFIPVHGEYRHMVHHADLAELSGIDPDKIYVCEDGDVVTLEDDGLVTDRRAVPSGYLYVDGIVGDIGQGVLRDRRQLAEEGVVVVILTVDQRTGEIVTGPEIVTKGWVYAPEAEELLEEAKAAVRERSRRPPPMVRPTSRPFAGTPAARSAASSTSGPAAARR